jgi:hypothetical protein
LPFQPSIHGWPFADALTLGPLPQEAGVASSGQEGLGAGMCWTALDRYLGAVRIRRDTPAPEPGDPLYAELVRRQAAAVCGLWPQVREWHGLSDRALASRTRATLRVVRRSLAAGQPVLLTLLPESDPYLRRRAARHVLATAWSRAEKQVTLSIYDPARPEDNGARLRFCRSGTLEARLASGEVVRGFFPVPYDRRRPTPLRAETFADRAVLSPARPVHGRIAALASRAGLDVVARSTDGTLLHFRRGRRTPWVGVSVTAQEGIERLEMHGDPAILRTRGSLHAFARGYVGDLLHFQLSRKWSVSNRTEQKRTGPRFRLAGRPVPLAGPWGHLHVFGRDKDSGIVHYQRSPLRRWSAAQIAGDAISSDPVAVRVGRAIHLFGVTADGRLLHWERTVIDWMPRDLTAGDRAAHSVPLAGPPVVVLHHENLHLVARDREDGLVHFRRAPDGEWRSIRHDVRITGDPAAMVGPAGVHVFGPGPEGELIHCWGDVEWKGEDLAATRPSLHLPGSPPARLTGWATPSELNVMGHWGAQIITLTWRDDSDWVAVPLPARAGITDRHLPTEDPLVVTDGQGDTHLFGIDTEGSVIHMEPAGSPQHRPHRAGVAEAATRVAPAGPPATPQASAAVPRPVVDEPLPRSVTNALEDSIIDEPWEMALTSELTGVETEEPREVAPEAAVPQEVAPEASVPREVALETAQTEVAVPAEVAPVAAHTADAASPAPQEVLESEREPEPTPKPVAVEAEPSGSRAGEELAKPARRGVDFEPMDLTSLELVPALPSSRRRRQRKKS